MVTPQLVDYIKEQIRAGIAREGIQKALLDAGWSQTDVDDSMKTAIPVGAPVIVTEQPAVAQAPAEKPISSVASADMKTFTAKPAERFVATPGQPMTSMNQPTASALPVVAQNAASSGSFQSRFSNLVKPNASASPAEKSSGVISKPMSDVASSGPVVADLAKAIPAEKEKKGRGELLVIILASLLVLALVGAGVLWFFMNKKIAGLEGQGGITDTIQQSLNEQVSTLTAAQTELNAKISLLTAERDELLKELGFFVALSGGGTSAVSVTIKADLSQQGGSYLLTTAHGVVLTIGNAKNKKVADALVPLVGQSIEVSGTHAPASRTFTLEAIAGVPIE